MLNTVNYNTILEKIEQSIDKYISLDINSQWEEFIYGDSLPTIENDLKVINAPLIDLLKRGGKRWRSVVLALSANSFSKEEKNIFYDLSLLVEIPHNGSLIIDDIEDRAEKRRGNTAIHLLYGQDTAINTGNLAYFIATALLENSCLSVEIQNHIYKKYLQVMRVLHRGQGLDIHWHNQNHLFPTIPAYLHMCKSKTGSLAGLSGFIGTLIASNDIDLALTIEKIWQKIGVGFQILDDVANLSSGIKGKLKGDDLLEGKKSLPLLYYSQINASFLQDSLNTIQSFSHLSQAKEPIEQLMTELKTHNCIEKAYNQGKKLIDEALGDIEKFYPENQYKNILLQLPQDFIRKMT